jgi:nucleotide-binding universal stress UspA family protein
MNLRLSTTHSPFGEPLNRFDHVHPKGEWLGSITAENRINRPHWLPRAPQVAKKTFRSVLVPLDGTPMGESAVPLAVSVARAAGAELKLVHVHAPMESAYFAHPPTVLDHDVKRHYTRYVGRMARRIGEAARITVIPSYLERRDTIEGLCESASSAVDLVVAATRAHGPLGRLLHGSIVHRLLRRLSIPLLVVRGDGLLPAISPDRWLRRMLVPLDGTRAAESAIDAAVALGSLYQADYSLLRVISPMNKAMSIWRGSEERDEELDGGSHRDSAEEEARRYLDGIQNRMNGHFRQVEANTTAAYMSIARSIVAKGSTADCIAMATGDRGTLGQLIRPSVAWQVIQQAKVPVLVVRGEGDS